MRPMTIEPFGSNTNEPRHYQQRSQSGVIATMNTRQRTEDSWIEVSQRPSSALSSNVDLQHHPATDRLGRHVFPRSADAPRSSSAAGSSQDEYEESSSESDRVLSSSNEDIAREEDDDDRTALGVRPNGTGFTPQPNAFTHPPSSYRSVPDSYFPQISSTPASALRSGGQRSRPHLQQQRTSGSYQPDHDAALRASLTTLLSCAAAVRPKEEQKAPERVSTTRPTQPTSLRLVPESELSRPRSPKQMKRRSRESSKERHAKKLRSAKAVSSEEVMSPTLTYWMISAGVVLVFSAISFSAGYGWGKEVGRFESEMGLAGGNCGRDAMRGSGLRRLRWSTTSSSITA